MSADDHDPAADPETLLPLDQWITYRCGLVSSRIGRFFAPMYRTRHGLKIWEWRALAVVARFQPLSASELADHSSSDPIQVARAITALTGKALISREPDPLDRRRAVLRLTAAGSAMHADIAGASTRIDELLRGALSEQEYAVFMRAFDLIDARMSEQLLPAHWSDFCADPPPTTPPGRASRTAGGARRRGPAR